MRRPVRPSWSIYGLPMSAQGNAQLCPFITCRVACMRCRDGRLCASRGCTGLLYWLRDNFYPVRALIRTWTGFGPGMDLDLDLDLHGGGAHNSGSSAFDFTLAWCHLEVIYVRTWAAHQELTHSIYRARSTSQTQQMTPTWDLEFGVAGPNDRIRRPAQASFVRGRCFGD